MHYPEYNNPDMTLSQMYLSRLLALTPTPEGCIPDHLGSRGFPNFLCLSRKSFSRIKVGIVVNREMDIPEIDIVPLKCVLTKLIPLLYPGVDLQNDLLLCSIVMCTNLIIMID